MLKIPVCIIMLLWSTLLFAQNIRTKLPTPAAWSNASGWFPSGVPVSGERIIIPVGVTVTTSADLTFSSLYLDILGKLMLGNNRSLTLSSSDSYINIQATGSIEASQTANSNSKIIINGLTQFVSNSTYSTNGGGKGLVNGPALATGAGAGFTFGIVLPVKFSAIRVQLFDESASITWQTSSEISNHPFTIERSADARTWTAIGIVPGRTSATDQYQFIDQDPVKGISYYRVCATDADGAKTYSEIVTSQHTAGINRIMIAPNPARSVAKINVPPSVKSEASKRIYRLYSNAGLLVDQGTISANNHELNVSRLGNGAYQILLIAANGDRYSGNLVIQH